MHYGFRIIEDLCDVVQLDGRKKFSRPFLSGGTQFASRLRFQGFGFVISPRWRESISRNASAAIFAMWHATITAHQCIDLIGKRGNVVQPAAYDIRSSGKEDAVSSRPAVVVREDDCVGCRLCFNVCPVENCIEMVELPPARLPSPGTKLTRKQPEVTEDWEQMEKISRKNGHRYSLEHWRNLWIAPGAIDGPANPQWRDRNRGAPARVPIFSLKTKLLTRVGRNLEASAGVEVIDATGKLVFPGFIDPHVHIYLPFMATFAKDTHETASIAALIGEPPRTLRCAAPTAMMMRSRDTSYGKPKLRATAPAITHSICQ